MNLFSCSIFASNSSEKSIRLVETRWNSTNTFNNISTSQLFRWRWRT